MFKRFKNINDTERIFRMALGFVLIAFSLTSLDEPLKTVIIVLATYGIVTGIVGYCPINEMLGNSSKKNRSVSHKSHKRSKRR